MTDTRHAKANKGNRIAFGVLITIVSLFCFLSLVGALGGVGQMVYGFLAGFFGLASYAYALVGLVIGVATVFNISPKMKVSRALIYFGLLFIGIYALNIYTSSPHIVGNKYADYLLACYHNTNTAGGMLFGIASYPLMKAITSVGALVVACVLFFVLAFFAIYPAIKRNVTYTVASSKDRRTASRTASKKQLAGVSRRKSVGGHRIEGHDVPTITDFSADFQQGEGLYVVDVEGDTMPYRASKRVKGADGYKPLNSFNPLYPNAMGAVEDEQILSPQVAIQSQQPVNADKFSPRSIAKDILFGSGASKENLSRFETVNDPRNALSNVNAPYSAVRRSELHAKLGIDNASQNAIREDFMSRYRAYQPDIDAPKKVEPANEPKKEESKPATQLSAKELLFGSDDSFERLKQEQTKMFGQRYAPEYEAESHETQQDESCVVAEEVKKEVVKPTFVVSDKEASIKSTIQKAEDAVNKPQVTVGMLGALNRAMSGEEQPKPSPKRDGELSAQAYDLPSSSDSVLVAQPVRQQEEAQPQPVKQPATQQAVVSTQQMKFADIEELDHVGYQYAKDMKMPRAFAATAIEKDQPKQSQYRMDTTGLTMQKPAVRPSNVVGGDIPSEPAPIQQSVTGGNMSRTAIQGATSIAKTSARDKESAEVDARIQNIRQALRETPPMSQIEKEALMRTEKVKASQKRGLKLDEPKGERLSQVNIEQAISQVTPKRPYIAPPISLLTPPAPDVEQDEDYEVNKQRLVDRFDFFGIKAEVFDVFVGPTFTLYKLRVDMPRGKSINSITAYESDIAMKMQVESVRVIAPIPGEDAVGIEVPNKRRRMVNLREVLEAPVFNSAKSATTFALGVDLYGDSKVSDVRKLPHLLVAGSTGAGKSCCVNSIIVSLLYKASPDDVRFIFVDPKRVELSVYSGIPHLLMDEIVCDADKAIKALNWALSEMDRRMKYFQSVGVRDIDEYNADCEKNGYDKMPCIVIVVDELAELMTVSKKSVEVVISRLSSLARAAGIHLILATQRPSVDVVSGTIKNNLPSRVAFRVTAGPDSRTILDAGGADKLLGNGDMLYMRAGSNGLSRIQGAFISNEEVKKVVEFIKQNNSAVYDSSIKDAIFKDKEEEKSPASAKSQQNSRDPNKITQDLCDSLRLGIELKNDPSKPDMSISGLQSRLAYGYPKASRIYAQMKTLGYIEQEGKRRVVNITEEEIEELEAQIESGDDEE